MSSGSSSSLSRTRRTDATEGVDGFDTADDYDYDDDDLPPPAASSRSAASAAATPLLGTRTPPTGLQPPLATTPTIITTGPSASSRSSPAIRHSRSSPAVNAAGLSADGSSSRGASIDGRLFTRERLTQARTAVGHLFSGTGDGDHTAWFKQLDEDYIKPRLLLDGAEAGRRQQPPHPPPP
ncbi:monovalent cation:H+ antiporter, CPA1 (nhx1) [Ascosphaera acerosa]|nr:monovalent cation:H+ antiporter, CPA1 (nhx1) [Ascosphaera acerosa]